MATKQQTLKTVKDQQWYFGMKAHIGVDSRTKQVNTVLAAAANVADRNALPNLLDGHETRVWGAQGYQGKTAVIPARAPHATDFLD
jgi:transposase, IS5 family